MRKVLIYFQDDRARRHQQKGRPPCGPPPTTPTIRKGQRGHLPRARRGSRGQSRSYVVARAQVRLAFSHLALPLPRSFFRFSCVSVFFLSFCSLPLLCIHTRARTPTRATDKTLFQRDRQSSPRPLCYYYALFCTMHHASTGEIDPSNDCDAIQGR